MGQARSPMTDFLIDCYFDGFCKGRKNLFRHSAESRLRAMPYSAELQLRDMPHRVEFRLCAMQHSAELKKCICDSSLCHLM
jgi:hypothetical protein